MGPRWPTKENTQLNGQNNFSFTYIKLVYCLTRKTLWCNSLVRKICIFLQKETSHCKSSSALGPREPKYPSTIFLATNFTQKMPKSSDSMYSSIFMLENICYHNFTWTGPNFHEIANFISIIGPRGLKLN